MVVDHTGASKSGRVIAVHIGGDGDIKYGIAWIGPIDLDVEGVDGLLEAWTEDVLRGGGYIELFPADGDALDELKEWVEEAREWNED